MINNDDYSCQFCETGYIPSASNPITCVDSNPITFCSTYNQKICSSCIPGYTVASKDDNILTFCIDDKNIIKNCIVYDHTDNTICLTCEPGFNNIILNAIQYYCVHIIDDCSVYTNSFCTDCIDEYLFKSEPICEHFTV